MQRALKLVLGIVLRFDGVGVSKHNLTALFEFLPQTLVVKVPTKALTSGVVDILNIGKNGDSGHGETVSRQRQIKSGEAQGKGGYVKGLSARRTGG